METGSRFPNLVTPGGGGFAPATKATEAMCRLCPRCKLRPCRDSSSAATCWECLPAASGDGYGVGTCTVEMDEKRKLKKMSDGGYRMADGKAAGSYL